MLNKYFYKNYLHDIKNDDFAKNQIKELALKLINKKSVLFSGKKIEAVSDDHVKAFIRSYNDYLKSKNLEKNMKEYLVEIVCEKLLESEHINPILKFHSLSRQAIGFHEEIHGSLSLFEYQYIPPILTSQTSFEPLENSRTAEQKQFLIAFLQDNWEKVNLDAPKFFQAKTIDGLVTFKLTKKTKGVMKIKFTLNGQQEYPTKVILPTAEAIQSVPLRSVWRSFDTNVPPKPIVIKTLLNSDEIIDLDFDAFLKVTPFIPSRFFLNFCHSSIGMEYLRYFAKRLRHNKTPLSMPCAEELHNMMILRLVEFENDKDYRLSRDDKINIKKFKQSLVDNKTNSYPYHNTLHLTYTFACVTSYLFLRYGTIGEEAHPLEHKFSPTVKDRLCLLNVKDSFAACQKAASSLSLKKLLSIQNCCFIGIGEIKCSSCSKEHLSLMRKNSNITNAVFNYASEYVFVHKQGKSKNLVLNFPVASDLSVVDFNKLVECPITLLGVLTKNYEYHDYNFMSPIDFLYHDAAHKQYNEEAISSVHTIHQGIETFLYPDVVSSVIRSAYLSFEKVIFENDEQKMLFEFIFFELTHEIFTLNKETSTILSAVNTGFALGGKYYGKREKPQENTFTKMRDEIDNVRPFFAKFYEEIKNACRNSQMFNPEKAWSKTTIFKEA